ncbi:adenylate/guanylate cyclase domain-containing protein [Treponema sp. HNW]|uniref:adenylate/guanylate cyclase domain-containing protein n=1 Tax=Treponema sp. HNW TaxID=3116654 RepID=UPI003D0BEF6E
MKFSKSRSVFIISIISVLFVIGYLSTLTFAAEDLPAPAVLEQGVMKIENPDALSDAFFELSGLWDLYWADFIEPQAFYSSRTGVPSSPVSPAASVKVPSVWNTLVDDPIAKKGKGAATYHLRVENLKPNFRYAVFMFNKVLTGANLYCNGKLVFSQGFASKKYNETIPRRSMSIAVLESDRHGNIDLVFHISNSVYRKAGIRGALKLSEEKHVRRWFTLKFNYSSFYAGALLSIMIYHLSLFFLRKYDWTSFYFSLFALGIFIRGISADFSLLLFYLPNLPYGMDMKLEYTVMFMAPLFYMLHLASLYNIDLKANVKKTIIVKLIVYAGAALGLAIWILPVRLANMLVMPSLGYFFVSLSVILVILFIELPQTTFEIFFLTVLSILLGLIGTVHDVLAMQIVSVPFSDVRFMSEVFIIFVFFQSLITAIRHENASAAIEVLSDNMQQTNKSYMRFVPEQFLRLLKKDNIVDVDIGDYTVRNVTLLCADIRNFTPISEQLGCKGIFDLLNACLSDIAPLIRKYGGFIEKYLGDCIVAIFPDNTPDIFRCAIEMQHKMLVLKTDKPISLRIGIGIHYGKVVLGTTGSAERLSQIAVSEAVDTVMRLESLTKSFEKKILVSGAAVRNTGAVKTDSEFKFIKIDTSYAKDPVAEDMYSLEMPDF